jgi:hypothetical protein
VTSYKPGEKTSNGEVTWVMQSDLTWLTLEEDTKRRNIRANHERAGLPAPVWSAETSSDFPLPEDSAERKEIPLWTGLFEYFPNALAETSRVSFVGNEKHNPGEDMHWARGKSMDQANCILRHMVDARQGHRDKDGMHHLAYAAWRALANLQLALEQERAGLPRWKP